MALNCVARANYLVSGFSYHCYSSPLFPLVTPSSYTPEGKRASHFCRTRAGTDPSEKQQLVFLLTLLMSVQMDTHLG